MSDNSNPNFQPTDFVTSKLRFYSIGIVAQNKNLGEQTVEVTPVEELPMLDGELVDQAVDYKANAVDTAGKAYSASVKTTTTLNATWLRFGDSNRMTAPDVRRGESVMIYQFGDADKYYWMTLKQDSKLRKLETVVWAISATKDEGKDTDATSSYYFEVSSHTKLVHFHTSQADGEPFMYDIQLNTKDGSFTLTDDIGNAIRLDSANSRLELINSNGTHVDMDKDLLTITVKGFVLNADTAQINADTIISKLLTVQQKTTLSGGVSFSGGGQGTGGLQVAGTVAVTGNTTVSGDVIADGAIHGNNI